MRGAERPRSSSPPPHAPTPGAQPGPRPRRGEGAAGPPPARTRAPAAGGGGGAGARGGGLPAGGGQARCRGPGAGPRRRGRARSGAGSGRRAGSRAGRGAARPWSATSARPARLGSRGQRTGAAAPPRPAQVRPPRPGHGFASRPQRLGLGLGTNLLPGMDPARQTEPQPRGLPQSRPVPLPQAATTSRAVPGAAAASSLSQVEIPGLGAGSPARRPGAALGNYLLHLLFDCRKVILLWQKPLGKTAAGQGGFNTADSCLTSPGSPRALAQLCWWRAAPRSALEKPSRALVGSHWPGGPSERSRLWQRWGAAAPTEVGVWAVVPALKTWIGFISSLNAVR